MADLARFIKVAAVLPPNASPEAQLNTGVGLGFLTWLAHTIQAASPTASSIAAICAAILGVVGVSRMVLGWFSKKHVIEVPSEVKVEVKTGDDNKT
jgi:hypothetical protein